MDRALGGGFAPLLASQEQYVDDFWRRSDVRVSDVREDCTKMSTVEIQQAIRFNLFHILQASARADDTGVPAKGLTGQAYEGHYFWDTEIYPAAVPDLHLALHRPLLLFYHPLNIYRKQVIKQADVVLGMFLLDDAFSAEEKKRNFGFYDLLTTGDSSLSCCVEAIIAAQTGSVQKAIDYGMAALLMDLADVGGNVTDGCHIASMGGTWMMLIYGFGGMKDNNGMLSFRPLRAPEDNAVLEFPVTWRGQTLGVKISPEQVEYSLRAGHGLVIRHEGEEIGLTPECPLAVRTLSGPVSLELAD